MEFSSNFSDWVEKTKKTTLRPKRFMFHTWNHDTNFKRCTLKGFLKREHSRLTFREEVGVRLWAVFKAYMFAILKIITWSWVIFINFSFYDFLNNGIKNCNFFRRFTYDIVSSENAPCASISYEGCDSTQIATQNT